MKLGSSWHKGTLLTLTKPGRQATITHLELAKIDTYLLQTRHSGNDVNTSQWHSVSCGQPAPHLPKPPQSPAHIASLLLEEIPFSSSTANSLTDMKGHPLATSSCHGVWVAAAGWRPCWGRNTIEHTGTHACIHTHSPCPAQVTVPIYSSCSRTLVLPWRDAQRQLDCSIFHSLRKEV